jgi:HPt (histidine-containing phosphotransfer) domain-containing protein
MAGAFVLDREAILDRLGGDEEIYTMMVDMYLQDVDNNCLSLAEAFAGGDGPTLQREVHTVKGLLATFSDDAGAADAFALEQKAKNGEVQGLDAGVLALQARLREVAAVLAGDR